MPELFRPLDPTPGKQVLVSGLAKHDNIPKQDFKAYIHDLESYGFELGHDSFGRTTILNHKYRSLSGTIETVG